jgi:hypothetical protein
MVIRKYLKCKICKKVIMLRYQVGIIDPSEFVISCNNCKSIIKGEFGSKTQICFDLINAEIDENISEHDQMIYISTEFPINKDIYNQAKMFSPFLYSMGLIGPKNVSAFASSCNYLMKLLEEKGDKLNNIIELYNNNSYNYVFNEIKLHFFPKIGNSVYSFKYISSLLYLTIIEFLDPIFPQDYINQNTIYLIDLLITPLDNKRQDLINGIGEIKKCLNIDDEFIKGINLIKKFLNKIKNFLQIIFLLYFHDKNKTFGNEFFISTFDYDDLKSFYVEQFELLSRISTLYFALDNLIKQGNINSFAGIKCSSVEEYYKKDNGIKKDYIKNNRNLDSYFGNTLDSQLRNGIGHFKTEYNPIEQIIKYFPYRDPKKANNFKEIFLIDFGFIILQQTSKIIDYLFVTTIINKKTA